MVAHAQDCSPESCDIAGDTELPHVTGWGELYMEGKVFKADKTNSLVLLRSAALQKAFFDPNFCQKFVNARRSLREEV
jgi:hypothetical protein